MKWLFWILVAALLCAGWVALNAMSFYAVKHGRVSPWEAAIVDTAYTLAIGIFIGGRT